MSDNSTSTSVERVIFDYDVRTQAALQNVEQLDTATQDYQERLNRLSSTNLDLRADLSFDDSALSTLASLDSEVFTPEIDPNLQRSELNDLEAVDTASYTPEIDPDLQRTEINDLEGLDSATYTPKVDVQETTEGKGVLDRLDEIRNLQVIDLTLNLAGQGLGAVQGIIDLVGATEAAADAASARLGETLPDAENRINALYSSLGADKTLISESLSTAGTLGFQGDDIDLVTQKAIEFSQVWGTDVTEGIRTAQLFISQGLVPDIESAFDLLTAGSQAGLNADGGLGGTLIEYASTIKEAGLTGNEALGLVQSGLAAGFDNADRVLDALREFGIRSNDTGDQAAQDALRSLGLPTPEQAEAEGGLTGAAYIDSVLTAIKNAPADEQRSLTTALFGTQAEDFGIDTILNLDPVNEFFDEIEGRSAEAATVFNDNIGATVAEFFRAAQVSVEGFLNNSTFRENLTLFQDSLKATLDALSSGESLPDAIEIGFKVEGFSEQVDRVQSAIGNFIIGLLQMVANIQEFLGKDASGTRAEVARLSEGQLAFDLQTVDPSEIGGLVRTALERGVSESNIAGLVDTAIQEQLSVGNVAGAQAIASGAGLQSATITTFFAGVQTGAETLQQGLNESAASFEVRLAALRTVLEQTGQAVDIQLNPLIDTSASQPAIEEAAARLRDDFTDAMNDGNLTEALGIAEQLGDPALVAEARFYADQLRGEFNTALAEDNVEGALEAAQFLPDDEALQTAATANAQVFTDAFNEALNSGDTATADAIAELLGDESLSDKVDEYRTKLGEVKDSFEDFTEASGGVSTSVTGIATDLSAVADSSQVMADALSQNAGDAGQAMSDLSAATANAVSGRSIVPDLESVAEAASTSLPLAGRYALLFAQDLEKASAVSNSTLVEWGFKIDLLAAKAAALTASLSSIPNSVGEGGAGGGTNVNINTTNYNQTEAAVQASNAGTDQYFRGY